MKAVAALALNTVHRRHPKPSGIHCPNQSTPSLCLPMCECEDKHSIALKLLFTTAKYVSHAMIKPPPFHSSAVPRSNSDGVASHTLHPPNPPSSCQPYRMKTG